ncbi:MAG: ThuA domain-containing protein, partial [Chitinophagaceae bacterium]
MRISCLVLAILFHTILGASAQLSLKKVLVFSKTMRYHHESIPAGIAAIEKLGKENGFMVDTSTNSSSFNTSNLKQYKAVIFLSTTGNVLDTIQKVAFQNFIRSGGGFVGIHSASSTEKSWQWYGKLLGAVFTDHPEPQNGTVWV